MAAPQHTAVTTTVSPYRYPRQKGGYIPVQRGKRPVRQPGRSREGGLMRVDMARLLSLLTVIAGVVIRLAPQTLNYIVAVYLIITAIVGFGLIRF